MSQYETITVKSGGYSLRRIIWDRYTRPTPGIIEPILEANPGLALIAYDLPVGTKIKLPVKKRDEQTALPKPKITLWG